MRGSAQTPGVNRPVRFKFNCNPGGLTFSQITKFYSKVYDIPIAKASTHHFGVSPGFVVKRGYRLLLNVGEWTFRVVQIDNNGIVLEGHRRQARRGRSGVSSKLRRWFRSRSVMEWLNSNHMPRKRYRALTGSTSHIHIGPRPVGARYWGIGPRIDTGLIGGRLMPCRLHSAPAGGLAYRNAACSMRLGSSGGGSRRCAEARWS